MCSTYLIVNDREIHKIFQIIQNLIQTVTDHTLTHTTYNCRIPIEVWPTPGDPDSQDVHNPNKSNKDDDWLMSYIKLFNKLTHINHQINRVWEYFK